MVGDLLKWWQSEFEAADAFSAFTSVIRTLARNGGDHSLVNGLCGVFSGAPVPTPSF